MATFIFNFKKRFAPAVERGQKLQTIRANRKDGRRPAVGDIIKAYTGLRTSHARLLLASRCTGCWALRMYLRDRELVVDGRKLETAEAYAFACADGFDSLTAMLQWFSDTYEGSTFEGFVTSWEPPKC